MAFGMIGMAQGGGVGGVLFVVLGAILSVNGGRLFRPAPACTACGSKETIPVDTPEGRVLSKKGD